MLPFSWSPGMKSPRSAIEQVLLAVLVEVDHLGVVGIRDLRDLAQRRLALRRLAQVDRAVAHVAGHDLGLAVAVEVEEAHVRDHRDAGALRGEGLLLEAQAAVARRPRRRQRQRHRGAGLEVADELRRVHLPQDALLAGSDARAHEAALGHLLDAQAPHAAGQVLRLGHDVALRALLLHGFDERRVGKRVGLAVEADDQSAGRRRRRGRCPLGRGGHGLGRRALRCGGLDGAEHGDDRKREEQDRGRARRHGHPVYIAVPRGARAGGTASSSPRLRVRL